MFRKRFFVQFVVALLFGLSAFSAFPTAEASVRVRGYYRSDGTYVRSHWRSRPDGNPYTNWSFPGNRNPYTGRVATGNRSTYLRNYYSRRSSTPRLSTRSYSSGLAWTPLRSPSRSSGIYSPPPVITVPRRW